MSTTGKSKKIVVLAGEKSGEMHAAKVCKELFMLEPSLKIVGWGGEQMVSVGVDVRRNINSLAIMGFWEVFKKLFFIYEISKECKLMIKEENPDAILYIDYSGFNLRIAKWASKAGYKNFYYIAPKTWAWNRGRTKKLASFFKKVYSILPFEVSFFKKYNVNVDFVGNPVLDTLNELQFDASFKERYKLDNKPIIALIPGSRASEVKNILPVMTSLSNHYHGYAFVVSGVSSLEDTYYESARLKGIKVIKNDFYNLLKSSEFAIVTSGTATLETALMKVPQIVCFKTSKISYFIAKLLIKVKYISLVNLINDELVVEELIQNNLNESELKKSFEKLLLNRRQIEEKYKKLNLILGSKKASMTVAKDLLNNLKQ